MASNIAAALSGFIHQLALGVPDQFRWPVFAALLALVVCGAVFLAARLYFVLDYAVASLFRRLGFAPPGLLYFAGEVVAFVASWTIGLGCLFVALTIAWAIAFGSFGAAGPPAAAPYGAFAIWQMWRDLLAWLWQQ